MFSKLFRSPPLRYAALLLLLSLLFGIANNAFRTGDQRMGWFSGQQIFEVYD